MVGREVVLKLLAFVGWVVLARLLDPGTFGLFAISSFAVNLFVVVSEVGLGAAFVRQQKVSSAELNSLFTYQLAWASLIALAALLAAPAFSTLTGLPNVGLLAQALAVSLIVISLRTVPSIISQRALNYGPMVLSDVAAQIAYWTAALTVAAAGLGVWSATAAVLAFAVVGTVVLYMRVGWRPALSFDWTEVHRKAHFSLTYQAQQGASLLKYAMLPALGGMVGSNSGAGYVTWAHQVAVVPIQLTQLVSRVSFPALALLQNRADAFADMTRTTLKWTCRLTFPACALLVGLGPQMVTYLYGPTWTPALAALYLFSINTAINAPVGVLMPALYSLGRGASAFRILLAMLVVTWVGGLLFVATGAGLQAPALGFLAGMGASLATVLFALRDLGGASLLRPVLLPAATAIAGALLLQLAGPILVNGLVSLVAAALIAGLAMLLANLWGEYTSIIALLKSFLARSPSRTVPDLPAPAAPQAEERQDVPLGTP
jgi:PST family polysaccharide transporter